MTSEPIKALFVGDGPLALQCLDVFAEAGGQAVALITKNETLAAQAGERGLRVIAKGALQDGDVRALSFDYLFSIANLDMLPDALLTQARIMAINFHDGPLPRYAGLNATSWALLNGEAEHGVTWHEMVAKADAGRIVAAAPVAIEAHETASSLNAKCFEAGLTAFRDIAAKAMAGAVDAQPQHGERTYFGRLKRPAAAATLSFNAPTAEVLALVRALSFAPYANPLASAKLWTGEKLVQVGFAERADLEDGRTAAPGTVLAADVEAIVVATADGAVRLSDFTCMNGEPVAAGVVAGAILPALSADITAKIDAQTKAAAKAEAFWLAQSARAAAFEPPYPRARLGAPGAHVYSLPAGDVTVGAAALAAWAVRVAGARQVSFAVEDGAPLGEAALWFSRWRPLVIDTPESLDGAALAEAVAHAMGRARAAGPLACDALVRRARGDRARGRPDDLTLAIGAQAHPRADITLITAGDAQSLSMRAEAFDADVAKVIADHVGASLRALSASPQARVIDLDLRDLRERDVLSALEQGVAADVPALCVHEMIARQAVLTPDKIAVRSRWGALTYAALDARANAAATALAARGVKLGDVVGVRMERGVDLVAAMLGVMKAGAAYLPLDPAYPADRLAFMLEDCGARFVIGDRGRAGEVETLAFDDLAAAPAPDWRGPAVTADHLAYLIYTSGSTGKPKGVKVHHGAVANFFVGMDARIPHEDPGSWLAVTSPNFDISVLELFWTLARGFTIALHINAAPTEKSTGPSFSLFYFAASSEGGDPYKLLLEGARFADENGFEAVWTPERHFHEFGGTYPNPAVTSAAVAAITKRVQIRAGSCVLPLHHPIRVAEDWSVIDNLSAGRVGLAFATGWQPNDFVLAPTAFADRKKLLMEQMDVVRRLWRGESVAFANPDGAPTLTRTLPRPVQKELPIWLTVAKSPETFEAAGKNGLNVLTHLLGMSPEELSRNVALYRNAWKAAGHEGAGRVTLMLHTFAGEDDDSVREAVRAPMKNYLRTSVDLVRDASWNFPTFVQRGEQTGKTAKEIFDAEPLTEAEMDALLDHAFERYFQTSGLFGSIDTCVAMVAKVAAIGVDEVACLVDFGIDSDLALKHLPYLKQVMERSAETVAAPTQRYTVAEDLNHFGATHLQCTPSMALMLADDPDVGAMRGLKALMVGGEALPPHLARALKARATGAKLLNMYGPTETTIWSTVAEIGELGAFTPLGEAIVNTTLRVASPDGRDQPALAAGELWIGGTGVTKGYWERPELNAERFVHPHDQPGELMYRTGDLVRRHADGALEFLGRLDFQVKIRGHRIELGEIEAAIMGEGSIAQTVVVARGSETGDARLVAYCVAKDGAAFDEKALRVSLAATLPEIMTPSAFVKLAALPLTPNGKIDRKALPEPSAVVAGVQEAPSDETESRIAALWSELLGVNPVGVTTNFFDMGGHSLLAFQMLRRLQAEYSRDLTITDVFRFPTVRALAKRIGAGATDNMAEAGINRARARLAARQRGRVGA